MNISPSMNIQNVITPSTSSFGVQKLLDSSSNQDNTFDNILSAYMSLLDQTNTYQLAAQQLQMDYASGETDDMLSVILAQEQAYSSLNFTVQVTNKVLDAYKQIMQTSL